MASDERKGREDRAWEAMIIACYLKDDKGPDSYDDPNILSEEDRRVIDAMGPDLVDRIAAAILAGEDLPAPNLAGNSFGGEIFAISAAGIHGLPLIGAEIAALHRGDEQLTPEAIEEMNRKARELLGDSEGEGQGA